MDKELAAALMAAKNKEHNFAIVAKGPTVVHLFVSKLPIKDAEVMAAKKEHGGNAIIRGKCEGENGELVFRVDKEPTVEVKKLKEFITTSTNLPTKPRFDVVAAAAVETETAEDEKEEKKTESTDEAAAFTTKLKAIKPALDVVRAAETSVTGEVKTLSAEVAVLAGKKEFTEAIKVLDNIAPLLKKGLTELAAKKENAAKEAAAKERAEQEQQQARAAQEQQEQARLEQQRQEQARLEKERLEQERLEKERLEKERLEKERIEQERLQQEKLEREKLEQARIEQEQQEQARLEKERLEKERVEKERLEKERLEKEKTTTPPTFSGLPKNKLPDKLPGVYFRKTGAPLFTLSTGDKTPDQLKAAEFIEKNKVAIFGPPSDPGSEELDRWNETLTKRGVNDAETQKAGPSTKELNCSFCTIGALLGKTSSEISVERQRKAGVTNPDPKQQEMTIWGNPTANPSLSDAATSDFNGQISPMKEMAKDFVDSSGGKFELVDNLTLSDPGIGVKVPDTFDEDKLIADMKKLPNGTRYSVFMTGTTPEQSHWCYAEKRNDFIIFRDYQQSVQIPKGRLNDAFVTDPGLTVDQLPLGPAKGDKIFLKGTFFAIKPTGV